MADGTVVGEVVADATVVFVASGVLVATVVGVVVAVAVFTEAAATAALAGPVSMTTEALPPSAAPEICGAGVLTRCSVESVCWILRATAPVVTVANSTMIRGITRRGRRYHGPRYH